MPSAGAGIGLRAPHYRELLARRPPLAFLEVHSENYFGDGVPLAWLDRLRAHYPVTLHGVGLSLGGTGPLDEAHLASLTALAARVEPLFVSEHLCWSSAGGRHANDLLPLPHTGEALAHVVARIQHVQERLGRRLLVENVSAYYAFPDASLGEAQFVAEVSQRAGCGLLVDVNNIFVNAANHGLDAHAWLDAMPPEAVAQYHLAGHAADGALLVDTHAAPVCAAVWDLFAHAVRRIGPRPTLLEWDADLPELDVLLGEAGRAQSALAA